MIFHCQADQQQTPHHVLAAECTFCAERPVCMRETVTSTEHAFWGVTNVSECYVRRGNIYICLTDRCALTILCTGSLVSMYTAGHK